MHLLLTLNQQINPKNNFGERTQNKKGKQETSRISTDLLQPLKLKKMKSSCNGVATSCKRTYWMGGPNGVLDRLTSGFVNQSKARKPLFVLHPRTVLLVFNPMLSKQETHINSKKTRSKEKYI